MTPSVSSEEGPSNANFFGIEEEKVESENIERDCRFFLDNCRFF